MDIDFFANIEQTFDDFRNRIEALEKALIALPGVNYEADPSRLPRVKVDPAAIPAVMEVPPNG
jgi:hypothetical protein